MIALLILACDLIPLKDLPLDTGADARDTDVVVDSGPATEPDPAPIEHLLELPCAPYADEDYLKIGVIYVDEGVVTTLFAFQGVVVDPDQISGAARSVSPDGDWYSMLNTGSAYAAKVATEAVQECEMLFWAPSGG